MLMTRIVRFIMSLCVAALLFRKPVSAGTFQGPCSLWGMLLKGYAATENIIE
jgi:hypothetical protein